MIKYIEIESLGGLEYTLLLSSVSGLGKLLDQTELLVMNGDTLRVDWDSEDFKRFLNDERESIKIHAQIRDVDGLAQTIANIKRPKSQ